ncbi:MAG: superinfection immunity protein [Acidithiobacillus sp.]|nr:superinfection immunity protein [Acidithiobacillus sp.]
MDNTAMLMGYSSFGPVMVAVMIFAFALAIVVYFIPSIVAYARRTQNFLAIFLLNLFLGWSLLGWVGSLIWALLDEKKGYAYMQVPVAAPNNSSLSPQPRAIMTAPPTPSSTAVFCPHCGHAVGPEDLFCAHCGHALRQPPEK